MILAGVALLLAGACVDMPSFGTGATCTPARQTVECGCSECMEWDAPAPTTPRVDWYDIERIDPDGHFAIVGGTWRWDWIDEDLAPQSDPPARVWCFARDAAMPREGRLYGYRVRACNITTGCSPYSGAVEYVAAPYAIDHFRPPAMGNP